MKKAIITGVLGQDGSLLAEKLLNEGYDAYGFINHQGQPSIPDGDSHLYNVTENCEIFRTDICICPCIEKTNFFGNLRHREKITLHPNRLGFNDGNFFTFFLFALGLSGESFCFAGEF